MRDYEAAALAAIDAAFAVDIVYDGAGLTDASLTAIKSDVDASEFPGPGNTLRQISFEVPLADLPALPRKGNTIVEVDTGATWEVDDITALSEIGKWRLIVVEAA